MIIKKSHFVLVFCNGWENSQWTMPSESFSGWIRIKTYNFQSRSWAQEFLFPNPKAHQDTNSIDVRVGADYKGMIMMTIMITTWLPRMITITIQSEKADYDYDYDYDYIQQWNAF